MIFAVRGQPANLGKRWIRRPLASMASMAFLAEHTSELGPSFVPRRQSSILQVVRIVI